MVQIIAWSSRLSLFNLAFIPNLLYETFPLDEMSNEGILIVDGKPLNVNQWLRYKDPNFNLFRHCGAVRIDCFISNASETRSNVWILEKHMLQASIHIFSGREGTLECNLWICMSPKFYIHVLKFVNFKPVKPPFNHDWICINLHLLIIICNTSV